jgi:hypothetical protein
MADGFVAHAPADGRLVPCTDPTPTNQPTPTPTPPPVYIGYVHDFFKLKKKIDTAGTCAAEQQQKANTNTPPDHRTTPHHSNFIERAVVGQVPAAARRNDDGRILRQNRIETAHQSATPLSSQSKAVFRQRGAQYKSRSSAGCKAIVI